MDVNGTCNDGFGAVRDAFAKNFDDGLEVGASVCVTVDGKPVVDLWAGDANESGDPWAEDTIVNVYSSTKTMASLCMLMLADRGQLDFSAPVAQYWPEFAANGKEGVLVSHVMAHTSGVCGFEEQIVAADLYDWDKCCTLLAAQAPWFEPGSQLGYQAVTQGYLQGEILRRITGQDIDQFFRAEVSGPLNADFHLSVDAEHDHRVGDLVPPAALAASETPGEDTIAYRTMINPVLQATEPKTREWRAAIIPAAGGFGNARSIGRVHSAMACGGTVDGVTLLTPEGVNVVLEKQHEGMDDVLMTENAMGMGFGISSAMMPLPPKAFFWGGWGGSLCMIDLDTRSTITYVMNRMEASLTGDVRGGNVVLAAFGALVG